jgi:hypothetical protein
MPGLQLNPEDGGSTFLRNAPEHPKDSIRQTAHPPRTKNLPLRSRFGKRSQFRDSSLLRGMTHSIRYEISRVPESELF